jgi:hypothetical protein
LLALALALALCAPAMAADLSASLSDAQSRAEVAAGEVGERQAEVAPARTRFRASSARAAPLASAARQAAGRVAEIEAGLRAEQQRAGAEVAEREADNRAAAAKQDDSVRSGLGFGLAALITAAIALGWGFFRASAPVAALTRIGLGQALGLCLGGGFLVLVIGAALAEAGGVIGVLGLALFGLGLSVPAALLLARHSAEIQRGRAKPIFGRERAPAWVGRSCAAVLALIFLVGFGSALFAGDAESQAISTELRQEAEGEVGTAALASAEAEAVRLDHKAVALLAVAREDRLDLRKAEGGLEAARARLVSAERDAKTFSSRLAALAARETREAEAEEERAEKLAAEAEAAEACNPNYSGCLDPLASDYDCEGGSGDGPLYTGTVEVTGYDEYGLDSNGDGIGCEP